MSLEFKHFDTRLNQWIHTDGDNKNPQSILTEKLDNTLLEFYFPGKEFSFGNIDEHSNPSDLRNHPDGHTLLLSSKTRLLYGAPECLEVIDKLCPDRKDRGAYGSIFLGACKNSINEELSILVVDDSTGENGNILLNNVAYKLVGDCYGQISTELYENLTKREEHLDKSYRLIQHRFGWREGDGEDTKYRFGKGTLRPYNLEYIKYANPKNTPKIDLIIPISSFKGTDKDNPNGASKPQIKPGLYKQKIWLGEKSQSERGKTAISQLLASFPQGIKDLTEELEVQAQKLAENQDDPRKVAELYCEKYEKRKAFTKEQKVALQQQIHEEASDGTLAKQLELLTWNEEEEEFEINDEHNQSPKDDLLMYKLIKADLMGGHNQLLETEKVRKELSQFVQNEWRDIAIGRTLTFDRGMIIPSKDLKNGEICVPWMDEGEKVLNFRSPFLNSNGLCVSLNKRVEDRLAPDGKNLEGIIVVNDEDHKRILARLEPDEIAPLETESERQGRDFDGDCIGVVLASKYPNFTAEAESRNLRENAYAPTVKLKKQSFYLPDGRQPPFEEIAIHMSDSISVGVINNQVTALEALESEIEILKTYGTPEQKSEYLDKVAHHYLTLFEAENYEKPKLIRKEYKPYMQDFLVLAQEPRTPEIIQQAMDINCKMYRKMIEEGCYQNQIAVDLFKSSKKPEMNLIMENSRYLYRDINYIKDKKSRTAYLNFGITTSGYSPVELLINQTNKYFQQSQLESRPIVQFQDLFRGVEFTPQQKFEAIAAKYEFDQKFNAAVAMERRREIERGPSAIIQTQQGTQIEITNLTRYGHPGIWQAQSINLKLEAIPEKYQTKERPHTLLAVAQINGEMEDGKPAYRKLGTVSQESVECYNLKPGMATNNATLIDLKPELSRGQTKLMFQQAYDLVEVYRASIPKQDRLSAAAAAWSVGAARQDELENKEFPSKAQKKIPNFVFAAFGDEIVSRLEQLQFTELRLGTLGNEANNFKDKVWNSDEKYAVEIRASHHPPGHERYGSRLVFVQDSDGEYKEYAMLEPRTGQLPIGTKAQVNFVPGETYTTNATVQVSGKEPIEFTIREISKFSYAGQSFNAAPVTLEIGTVPVPNYAVKIKLDGKVLGELDTHSVKQLQAFNYIKDGNPLNLKLTTISDSKENAFIIAESPNGNLLKLNKINFYDYQGQTFNDENYRKLTLEVPPSKSRDAVFLNGEPLGVLHFKKDKEALKELGVLNVEKLTFVQATLQSNFTITVMKVDPETIEYPEVWTKESQVFGQKLHKRQQQQQQQFENSAHILQKIKERPTILYATPEDKMLGLTQLVVDNHKVETVTKWLTEKNVAISQVLPENVPLETKKGLAVFNLVNSSIPESVSVAMTKKFGEVIESQAEYQDRVNSFPDRPHYLKPPQPKFQSEIIDTVGSPNTLQSASPSLSLANEAIQLPDSKSSNRNLSIEIMGKVRSHKVRQLRSHLETHIKPILENDKSNYAPGRQVAWVGAKWDLKDKDFKPGVRDDRLMELVKQVYPDADIALVTYSSSPGAGINYHRDDSYAAVEARSINIGNSEWGYRSAKEQMVWTSDENTNALYHEFKLESGTVTRFNCKNEHAALNTEASRWSINIWSIKNDLGRENSVRQKFENFLTSNQPPRAVVQSHNDLTIKTDEWIPGGEIKVERSYTSLKEATRNLPTQQNIISGKPIPMNYPLMLHGEQNPLPVDTCIDAMRGYGRVHTTRAYEPYKQYGFEEGDIAIAIGGGKQVAFRVGKQYQITPEMIADPQYQKQWADMEKHSAKALPELFTGKPQVWGLHIEPLGDYMDGKIIPFPEPQKKATPNQEFPTRNVTIDNLRDWYSAADKLGKSEEYKKRIVEVANEFKQQGQLSPQALAAMGKDTEEFKSISRLTQIAQRVGAVWGQVETDGLTQVKGKVYDLSFNTERKDLQITQKSGEVMLSIESGKVQTNNVTPKVLQNFEQANNQVEAILARNKIQKFEMQH